MTPEIEENAMSKYIVTIFSSEAKAYEGKRALFGLHEEGSITLYDVAVVSRDANGTVMLKDTAGEGPIGLAVGGLAGGVGSVEEKYEQARDETKADLRVRMNTSRDELRATFERAQTQAERLRQEAHAEVKVSREQAAHASSVKARIDARIVAVRAE